MATGRAYSGREWSVLLGIADNSESNGQIGKVTQDDTNLTASKVIFRVETPANDIAWDAGYNRVEIERAGSRAIRAEDVANHYGSGTWTWDFSYVVDSLKACNVLQHLVYPSGGGLGATFTIPANPTVEDYTMSSSTETTDVTGFIVLANPATALDHYMHSAVLQNLNIAMSADSNGGLPTYSGQFMSGYKPIIEANTVTADTVLSDYSKGLFDCTTHTFATEEVSLKSFSMNIENPASRVGYQGSDFETDGYVRGARFNVSGEMTFKADATAQAFLTSKWQTNTTVPISVGDGSTIDFSIPAANISGFSQDMAEDGSFITCSWVATSGPDGTGNLAVLKNS